MKISEIARIYHISKRTLRYYEELGLLESKREDEREERRYSKKQIEQLEHILLLKKVGLPLKEIQAILEAKDVQQLRDSLQFRLAKIEDELHKLHMQKEMIKDILPQANKRHIETVHFYKLIEQQIYLKDYIQHIEGMKNYMKDMIEVQFGQNLIQELVEQELPRKIGELKEKLKGQMNKDIPLIRIRDNTELSVNQYTILIKGVVVTTEEIVEEKCVVERILQALEKAVIQNQQLIE